MSTKTKSAPKATKKASSSSAAKNISKAVKKEVPAKNVAKAAKPKTAAVKKSAPKAAKKEQELKEVVFNVYSPDSKQVEVAGEFNDWTPAKMKKGEQGVWSIKKNLAAGTYQYKFIFDGSWEIDQANPDRVPDGQGGENSIKNV